MPAAYAETYARPEKIVMLWDYISRIEDNLRPEKRIKHRGLDVLSPTWFSIRNGAGDLSSLADRNYVRWAHDNGIKVWAVFENESKDSLTATALSNRNKRKKIIDQLAGFAWEYNLDGINIDFEAMSSSTGKLFELFMAELYERLHPLGITISVDIPFPVGDIQKIYNIGLIAKNCDYVVMMGYDQHHRESHTFGPVAAIDWVRQGIKDTLQHVGRDRIILGIPFYTRVWEENREGGAIRTASELMGMKEAYDMFNKTASVWGRDRATEQIYAEFDVGQKRYKAWLEDIHSLSLKLDAVYDYNLAGLSAWRRGWEWNEIWDMINKYFQ